MKIVAISDLHENLPSVGTEKTELPVGDVLCIAGDITLRPKNDLISQASFIENEFCRWANNLVVKGLYKNIVWCGGNHDQALANSLLPINFSNFDNRVIYIEDEEIIIDGIKFYGTPWQAPFCDWAFNASDEKRDIYFSNIPEDVDVLITHAPPKGLGKTLFGDDADDLILTKHILHTQPKFNFCGHIHECSGLRVDIGGCQCYNVSYVNFNYEKVGNAATVEL